MSTRETVLVSAEWVGQHLDDPGVVLVEVDEDTSAYDKNHIRNAIRIDVHTKSFEAADRLRGVLAANPTFADTRVTSEIASDKSGGKTFNLSIRLGDREKAS